METRTGELTKIVVFLQGWSFLRVRRFVGSSTVHAWLNLFKLTERKKTSSCPKHGDFCPDVNQPRTVDSVQVLQGGLVWVWRVDQPQDAHRPPGQGGYFKVWSHTGHLQEMWLRGRLEYHDDDDDDGGTSSMLCMETLLHLTNGHHHHHNLLINDDREWMRMMRLITKR